MSAHNIPTLEQMERDTDCLRKLRGYCSKAIKTLEDLPCARAYRTLSSQLFLLKEGDNKVPSLEDCKYSLHRIWSISYCIEGYIQQIGGPRRATYKSKLSDEEIAKRMGGEYSHTRIAQPACFHFTENEKKTLRQFISKIDQEEFDFFVKLTAETITEYLFEKWEGKPNREDDVDKLNTLHKQVERVLGNTGRLIEMTMGRYKYSDCVFLNDIGRHVGNLWELLFVTEDATKKIKQLPRRSKPLEYKMVNEIAYSFWRSTGIKPSARNKFMEVVSVIECALENYAGHSLMGAELIEAAIKELPKPTPKSKKSAKPPQTF
ncbi:MAG: hypothetical protein Q7U78_03015 [Gallionella sp.]|nr:hypothetical protein [Gallionella sp.]